MEKMTVSGTSADIIERAIHAGFYGINGDNDAAREARKVCNEAIADLLVMLEIQYSAFEVLDARITGERMAQILFKID